MDTLKEDNNSRNEAEEDLLSNEEIEDMPPKATKVHKTTRKNSYPKFSIDSLILRKRNDNDGGKIKHLIFLSTNNIKNIILIGVFYHTFNY